MPHSILIVEDDLTFATMLKTWLGKKGFSVDTASSNARARKQLDAQPYDLVLSDLRLPDQDGIFLLSWMKEQKYNIPLIIMTGYADIQSAVQAIKHGASDYISKPIQPDELLKKINEALQNKALPTPVGIEKNTVAPKASKNKAVPHSAVAPKETQEAPSSGQTPGERAGGGVGVCVGRHPQADERDHPEYPAVRPDSAGCDGGDVSCRTSA